VGPPVLRSGRWRKKDNDSGPPAISEGGVGPTKKCGPHRLSENKCKPAKKGTESKCRTATGGKNFSLGKEKEVAVREKVPPKGRTKLPLRKKEGRRPLTKRGSKREGKVRRRKSGAISSTP